MNVRLLGTYSVPIKISSPEFQVSDRCVLHELHNMERYVTTTYRLQTLHVSITRWTITRCLLQKLQGGYVSSTQLKNKIDALNVSIKFFSLEFLLCYR